MRVSEEGAVLGGPQNQLGPQNRGAIKGGPVGDNDLWYHHMLKFLCLIGRSRSWL